MKASASTKKKIKSQYIHVNLIPTTSSASPAVKIKTNKRSWLLSEDAL